MGRGRIIVSSLLAVLAVLAVLGSAESAHAELYLDFDEWTEVCTTLGPGCDGAFLNGVEGFTELVREPDRCFAGQCTTTEFLGDGSPLLIFGDGVPARRDVYFETRFRVDVGAAGPGLMTGDRIRLLELKDEEGGYLITFTIIAPNHLQISFFDTVNGGEAPILGPAFPMPGELGDWRRLAVYVSAMDSGEARVVLWVGDDARPLHDDNYPLYQGTFVPRRPGTWAPFGLGPSTFYTPGLFRALYLDEVCLGESEEARDGYCLDQRLGGVTDAGVGTMDSSVADGGLEDSGAYTNFRGGGGCTCDASSDDAPLGGLIPLALLAPLALVFRRRRRR